MSTSVQLVATPTRRARTGVRLANAATPTIIRARCPLELPVPSLAVFFWVLNAFFDAVGQLSFKAAARTGADGAGRAYWMALVHRPWLWVGIVCFGAEFLVWLAFLSLVPLSEGVLLGTVNVVILMLAGRLLFAERLTRWRLAGMALVAVGVTLVGVG